MTVESMLLVRHGHYRHGDLTPEGIKDAEKARDELLARDLGGKAIILSSSTPRTVQTAGIIAEGLGAMLFPSERIMRGGIEPAAIRNLDEWVEKALVEADLPDTPNEDLIVVAHAPMLAVAKGVCVDRADDEVGYGEVIEYRAGTWDNPEFRDYSEVETELYLQAQAKN